MLAQPTVRRRRHMPDRDDTPSGAREPEDAAVERDRIVHKWTRQDRYRPVFVAGAAGSRFNDEAGHAYLDAFSQSWYALAGHGERRITDAIAAQAAELASIHAGGLATAPRGRLATRLFELLPPGFRRVFFGSNGSDAVEAALKLTRLATGRQGVIAFEGSYHGASMGSASVSGLAGVRAGFGEPVPGTHLVPFPGRPQLVEEAILAAGARSVAAVVAEPVQAVRGVILPPPGYRRRVREICDRYEIALVFDEVVTGFGRTGTWFAFQQFDAVPDVLCLGKGFTSGYQPLSAAVFGPRVMDALERRPLYHGLTFEGHSAACAAALANLDVIADDGLVARAAALGDLLGRELEALAARHGSVTAVRGLGAMWGIELDREAAPVARRLLEESAFGSGRTRGPLRLRRPSSSAAERPQSCSRLSIACCQPAAVDRGAVPRRAEGRRPQTPLETARRTTFERHRRAYSLRQHANPRRGVRARAAPAANLTLGARPRFV